MKNVWMLAAAAMLVLAGCNNDGTDEGPDGSGTEPVAGKTVKVTPDRTTMLRNPLSGWVLYSGLGDGLADNYWDIYDRLECNGVPEGFVKVSDYASILLIRVRWSQANPERGKYIWEDDVDTKEARRFRMLVEGAKERNLKLAFNFTADSRDFHFNMVPEYVREDIEAEGRTVYESTTGTASHVWTPYPDDPVFQRHYATFMREFAKEFDNSDITAFIGGFGVGLWGEYHTCIYSTGDETPREEVYDWLVDLWADTFKNIPMMCQVHRWIGSTRQSWGKGEFDPESERLIAKAVDKGYSLQSAAFGMRTYFSDWEKRVLASHRYSAPAVSEGGWVRGSHTLAAIQADGYQDWGDVRRGEYEDAIGSCVNTMDFRYNSNIAVSETWSWFNEAFEYVQKFISEGCYRLYPQQVTLPEQIAAGDDVTVAHRWVNLGHSYCPSNIPQYHDKWRVAFALLDKQTEKPVKMWLDGEARPCHWIKGKAKNYRLTFKAEDVAAGDYKWAVGIVDTEKENSIGIYCAAKDVTSEGWVRLCDVTVK